MSAPILLDNLSTAVVLLDRDFYIVSSNNAAQQMLSLSSARLRNAYFLEVIRFPVLFESRLRGWNLEAMYYIEREVPAFVPPSHKQLFVDCTVSYLPDCKEGTILLELSDLGYHPQARREESRANQRRSSRQLLNELAHEIKNPLGGLRGAAQLLERKLSDPSLCEYTRIIVAEADRLSALLDRFDGPEPGGGFGSVNIHEILERVRQLLCSESTQSHIECDYDPSIPTIYGNSDWLMQVFLNIAQNAVQAAGGSARIILKTRIKRSITLRKKCHKLVASISIIDHGPGVPDELANHLFFPMVSGRDGGSGLGLAITQDLTARMGGDIEYSRDNGQTCFCIDLPILSDQLIELSNV